MPLLPDTRSCLSCGNMLAGRIDKKFCDDYCRSMYNNRVYNSNRGASFIRKVNSILRRNRRILEELLPTEESVKVPKSLLMDRGFNFNYLTAVYGQRTGAEYHFCYEYGYLPMEGDMYCIVKRSEVMR
ncbi:MAG TPA: hypothetical protein VD993_07290 [Chitinophagaceae bacterium]|nr:hypothetical protein [Chitinophagaceae bacterium]